MHTHSSVRNKEALSPGCVWESFAKQGTGAWGRRYEGRGAGRRVGSMCEGKKVWLLRKDICSLVSELLE